MQHAEREKTAAAPVSQGDRASDLRSSGVPRTCPRRRSPARRVDEPPIAELRAFIDWTFFFTAWELKGRYPKILDHPKHGAAARELFDNAKRAAGRDRATRDLLQARGVYGFWPANAEGDDIVLENGRASGAVPDAPPADRQRRRSAEPLPGRLHRAGRDAAARPHRRVRGHRRASAPTTWSSGSRPTTTTTARSWSRRSPTGWPRRSPSTCTSRRGARGDTRRRRCRTRSCVAETVPRHPAGVRLPGLSRPQSEAHAVRSAGGARDRHRPDRSFAMTPAASVSRPVLRTPGVAVLQRRSASRRTSSRTTPAAGARASREAERWLRPNLAYDTD